MKECKIENLYNLDETIAKDIFAEATYPWEVLPKIEEFIINLGKQLDKNEYEEKEGNIWIAKSAKVGAGSITSNVKSDKKLVIVKNKEEQIETGLKKFGAMIGDEVEVGCGSILNPGSVIGKNTNIYPLSSVRGVVAENSIYKNKNEIIEKIYK